MSASALQAVPPTKRRQWFRLSLRSLLILVAIAGIVLGLLGNFWRNLQQKRHAIALIEAAGGQVHYEYEFHLDDDLDSPRPEFRQLSFREVAGRTERTTTTEKQTIVEIETPPGPQVLRRFLGDNAFAEVDAVSFDPTVNAVDLDPHILEEFRELQVVWLTEQQMRGPWLDACARVPQLKALNLSGVDQSTLTGTDIARLQGARNLKLMSCTGQWINDETVAGLAKMSLLEAVFLADANQLTAASFESLSQLPELRSLTIIRAKGIDDRNGTPLSKLTKLHTLWLPWTSVGDQTMHSIGELRQLEVLWLSATKLTDASAPHIGKLSKLTRLALDRTEITDAGVEELRALTELRNLALNRTNLNGDCLATISQLPKLHSLNLESCPRIPSKAFLQLRNMKSLRSLRIGPNITPKDLLQLQQALPNCEVSAYDARGLGIKPEQSN